MRTHESHFCMQDRLSWLWLLIAASLLPFAYFRTVWPFAAWLAPVFLMRFSRTQRLAVGLPLVALAEGFGAWVGLRDGYIPAPVGTPPGPVQVFGAGLFAVLFSIPFVVDRVLAGRLSGALRTLAFPTTAVTIDFAIRHEDSNLGTYRYST
jgi:apolipoprotein N-acyltransferase